MSLLVGISQAGPFEVIVNTVYLSFNNLPFSPFYTGGGWSLMVWETIWEDGVAPRGVEVATSCQELAIVVRVDIWLDV